MSESININDEPDAKERRDQILTFRTITSLLSDIPHRNPIEASDNIEKLNKNNLEIIKVCDALAHVLVMEHEVIAVAADHQYEMLEGGVLRIVASTEQQTNVQPISKADGMQDAPSGTIMSFVIKFMLTYNPPELANIKKSSRLALPSFEIPNMPEGITKATVLQYLKDVPYHKTTPSLPQYLWNITQALVAKPLATLNQNERRAHRDDLSEILMMYICAVCHKKMRRRFRNPDLSQPYLKALEEVNITGLPSIPLAPFPRKEDADAFVKMISDRLFLEEYIIQLGGTVPCPIKTPIPNLIRKAKEVMSSEEEGFQLYTDETRKEFHLLLVETLRDFGEALDNLAQNLPGSVEFQKALGALYRSGYVLLRISRGLAFQMHVNSIIGRLAQALNLPEMRSPNSTDADTEINYIRNLVLPKSFITWLRLMVGHFDSMEVLIKFATSPAFRFTEISASFMVVEEPDAELLPWRDLFDRKFLPEPEVAKKDSDKEDSDKKNKNKEVNVTNDTIRQFLDNKIKDAMFAKTMLDHSQNLLKRLKSFDTNFVTRWVKNIEKAIDTRTKELDAQSKALSATVEAKETAPDNAGSQPELLKASPQTVDNLTEETAPDDAGYQLGVLEAILQTVDNLKEETAPDDAGSQLELLKTSLHTVIDLATEFMNVKEKMTAAAADLNETVETWIKTQIKANAAHQIFYAIGTKKFLQGTLHCEAYLASFLPLHMTSPRPALLGVAKHLEPFRGQEIGVSKRCCPVCLSYLEIIQGRNPSRKFLVRGSHDCISACTLPPWTPIEYLRAMNEHWGKILRDDLISLMAADPSIKRHRARTTGSMGRSSDQSIGNSASGDPYPRHNNLMKTFFPPTSK